LTATSLSLILSVVTIGSNDREPSVDVSAVKWDQTRYDGIYRREDNQGRVRYRAVVWARDPDWTPDPALPINKPGRKQFSKTFDRIEAARTWREDFGGSTPKPAPSKGGRQTLQGLYEEWHEVKGTYSDATVRLHADLWGDGEHPRAIDPLKHRPVNAIDSADIDRALAKITKPGMRSKTRSLLSVLFGYAVDQKRVSVNPVPKQTRSTTRQERMESGGGAGTVKPALSDQELARLVAEMPERYRALIETMAYVGLRPGEAYALRVGKFDAMRRTLRIDTSASGFTKTGEARTLTLPKVVAELLTEHIARFSDPTDPDALVFPSASGSMVDHHNWRVRVFSKARTRAGISGSIRPNQLRHTAAARAIGNGANVYDVQRMLGHARPSITLDTYGYLWHGSPERLAETLDAAIRGSRVPAADAQVTELPQAAGEQK
jgi:integrase